MQRSLHRFLIFLVLGVSTLLSCNLFQNLAEPTAALDQDALFTVAAKTLAAEYTLTAAAQPSTASTPTPSPSSAQNVSPLPTSSPQPPCNHITFIGDATIPDGTLMTPGNEFIKTWRLQNSGICSWTADYALIFDHGDKMSGASSVQFTNGTIEPGEALDISVRLTAPENAGTYQGHWKLRSNTGEIFGLGDDGETAFWVEIRVTTMGAEGAGGGEIYVSGSMEFGTVVATGDLDEGVFAPEYEDADISLHPVDKQLEPKNGALIALWGNNAPSFSDCAHAALSTQAISANEQLVGKYLCYRTNLGKSGMLYVTLYNENTFAFDFVTWKKP